MTTSHDTQRRPVCIDSERQKSFPNRAIGEILSAVLRATKSVSILTVTLQDGRLIEAHTESVRIALRELETFAALRIRRTGAHIDRKTSNLIAAEFLHTSSRVLDPQLHTHFIPGML